MTHEASSADQDCGCYCKRPPLHDKRMVDGQGCIGDGVQSHLWLDGFAWILRRSGEQFNVLVLRRQCCTPNPPGGLRHCLWLLRPQPALLLLPSPVCESVATRGTLLLQLSGVQLELMEECHDLG